MGIFKRIKELELKSDNLDSSINIMFEELWALRNPPKFKNGDECIFKSHQWDAFGTPRPSEIPVFILSEKGAFKCERIYYVSDSLPVSQIHVIEVNESRLALIKSR